MKGWPGQVSQIGPKSNFSPVATPLLHREEKLDKTNRLKPVCGWLETVDEAGIVAHTGFEPVISALRGRCPKPLDECAVSLMVPLGRDRTLIPTSVPRLRGL